MKTFFTLMLVALPVIAFAQKKAEQSNKQIFLPADLIEGRFFLKIPTIKGDTILGFCDTGGGYTAIYNSTVKKLGLESKVKFLNIDDDTTKYISAEEIYDNRNIPYPQISNYFKTHINIPFIQAPDDDKESIFFAKFVNYQIFLGQYFFINNSWTFNYKTGEISINTLISKDNVDENIQVLGFKKDKMGNKIFGHPRMKLVIDGKSIDFLFDTGATFLLSDYGKSKLGIEAKATAGSFIAKSIFNEWHLQHPDWRIIEKGEFTGADLEPV